MKARLIIDLENEHAEPVQFRQAVDTLAQQLAQAGCKVAVDLFDQFQPEPEPMHAGAD